MVQENLKNISFGVQLGFGLVLSREKSHVDGEWYHQTGDEQLVMSKLNLEWTDSVEMGRER